jgi:hypothetical protein
MLLGAILSIHPKVVQSEETHVLTLDPWAQKRNANTRLRRSLFGVDTTVLSLIFQLVRAVGA